MILSLKNFEPKEGTTNFTNMQVDKIFFEFLTNIRDDIQPYD